MSLIHFKIEQVDKTGNWLKPYSRTVSNIEANVSALKTQVDYKIQARHNISKRLYEVNIDLVDLQTKINDLKRFIHQSARDYNDAENKVQDKGEALEDKFMDKVQGFSWELYKAGMGAFSTFTAGNMLRMNGLQFKVVKTKDGKRLYKLVNQKMGSDPQQFARLQNQLRRVYGQDFDERFTRRLLNQGIPLYDKKWNNVLEDNLDKFTRGTRRLANEYGDLKYYIQNAGDAKAVFAVKSAGKAFKEDIIGLADDFRWGQVTDMTKATKLLGALGTGITLFENAKDAFSADISIGEKAEQFVIDTAVDVGTGASAVAIGAAAGSLIAPPIGTIVGAAVGGGINFAMNVELDLFDGQSFVDATKEAANELWDDTQDFVGGLASGVGKKLDEIFW